MIVLPAATQAEQASQPTSPAAGQIDSGRNHTCAILPGGPVRCWGFGREGELGYGNTKTIGDDETPAAAGPVDLGDGRTATAISAGDFHTCALLNGGDVRCWGFPGNGRLGYGNQDPVGDNETPGSVEPVDLGAGLKAKAISAGRAHTCALLSDDTVRCWGYAYYGQLGYGNPAPEPGSTVEPDPMNIGDNEPPGSVGPVELGAGRTAVAVSAGDFHTCAVLDNGDLRCWGSGGSGRLGYGNQSNVGDRDTPALAGPVSFGDGLTAKAVSGGATQTCAVLRNDTVRCWGFGGNGRLGYGNETTIGDSEQRPVSSVGAVNLAPPGDQRTAKAVSVGDGSACATLDNDTLRCWGFNVDGRLGYANKTDIGDDELPGSVGPVNLGTGRTALAITLGARHACARTDDANVRCWGYGANGRLGYCNSADVGDDETPGSRGPVDLGTPSGGAKCSTPKKPAAPAQSAPPVYANPREAEAMRARALRSCLSRVARHARSETRSARRRSGRRRARAIRHLKRHRSSGRRACLKRHGRTPGRVTGVGARAVSKTKIILTFNAPGSDGVKPPPARAYLVKQSRRPIRGARDFRRAETLCKGSCRFPKVRRVGAKLKLTIRDLRPGTTYHYAVAARDNVSRRLGRRSRAAKVRTRR
ncbi:MAG: hypothetical protein H0V57_02140 [Thermoleophilaceae bacterium]|nr:hypothetical protein [Thermoleophilaceae bacterium]